MISDYQSISLSQYKISRETIIRSQKNSQSASFLPSSVNTSRIDRVRDRINSKHRGKSRVNSSDNPLSNEPPLSLSSTAFTNKCEVSSSQFLNSSIPSSPFLTTSSIQPPWNKYNERDVAGVEREISYTRLRDRYSWLPARNTGVGKASGNVETRIKADPASLFLLIYLFIYFFLICHRQI